MDHDNDALNKMFRVGAGSPWPEGWMEVASQPGAVPVKRGGWLALHGDGSIYATKGNKTYEFYKYDVDGDSWTQKANMPLGQKYPDKGSKGISDGEEWIYATKGKNTYEFYRYNTMSDSWYVQPSVPEGPRRKKVKGGTDMEWVPMSAHDSTGMVYMMKGYYTEFYKFDPDGGYVDGADRPADRPEAEVRQGQLDSVRRRQHDLRAQGEVLRPHQLRARVLQVRHRG